MCRCYVVKHMVAIPRQLVKHKGIPSHTYCYVGKYLILHTVCFLIALKRWRVCCYTTLPKYPFALIEQIPGCNRHNAQFFLKRGDNWQESKSALPLHCYIRHRAVCSVGGHLSMLWITDCRGCNKLNPFSTLDKLQPMYLMEWISRCSWVTKELCFSLFLKNCSGIGQQWRSWMKRKI